MTARAATLACQACAGPLDADDGARSSGAIRCRFCGAWNRVEPAAPLAGLRVPADRPSSIRVEEDGRCVRIVRRWFSPVHVVLLFFSLFWNAVLLFFYRTIASVGAPAFVWLFPVLHVLVGAGIFYVAIAGLVNRTVLTLGLGTTLSIRHGPLPWPGGLTLDAGGIAQIFVTGRTRGDDASSPTSYVLAALTRDGRRITLLRTTALPLDAALFLEEELERHLRIRDVPVIGEVARA